MEILVSIYLMRGHSKLKRIGKYNDFIVYVLCQHLFISEINHNYENIMIYVFDN